MSITCIGDFNILVKNSSLTWLHSSWFLTFGVLFLCLTIATHSRRYTLDLDTTDNCTASPIFYIPFFNLTAHCSLSFPCQLCFYSTKFSKSSVFTLVPSLWSHSLFSLVLSQLMFHIIVSSILKRLTLFSFFLSFYFPSKSLTLLSPHLLLHIGSSPSGGKRAHLLTDSHLTSWPRSFLSTQYCRLSFYLNICLPLTLRSKTVSEVLYLLKLPVFILKHALCAPIPSCRPL